MKEASLLFNFLIAFGAGQALFLTVVLLKSPNRSVFKKLLAGLLFIEGITLLERLAFETQLAQTIPHILGISSPISFIKPPLLLFMSLSLTDKHFKLRPKHLWHLIVFLFMLLINIPFYFLSGTEKVENVTTFMNYIPAYDTGQFYFILSFFAYIGIYLFLSLKRLAAFKLQIAANEMVNWYSRLLRFYTIFLGFHLSYFVLQPALNYQLPYTNVISMLIMTFIIQAVAYKLLIGSAELKNKVPDLSDLEKRKFQEEAILNALTKEKVYLQENLNLSSFAQSINLSPTEVSEIIQQKFNTSFKRMLMEHRILEAKNILKSSLGEAIKLIDVAYDSGFNNKVSFYRAFKLTDGISPSEYLEKLKEDEKK